MNKRDSIGRYGDFMQQREAMHCEHCGMTRHTMSVSNYVLLGPT